MRGKAHSEETKAQVMAALLAGQSINQAAEAYKVPVGTVGFWASQSSTFKEVQTQKRAQLDELITEYVTEAFTTLSVQARHFRDLAWLKEQPADELAVLHGVITDKAIRILSAAEPPPGTEVEAPGDAAGTGEVS